MPRTSVLGALLLLAACAGGSETPTRTRLTLVEDFRIGGADTGKASFTGIAALAFDGSGKIWVLDRQAHEIRVFDQRGAFVRAVGRAGEGPGEFVEANGFALDDRGLVWIPDHRLRRYLVIDTLGAAVGAHTDLIHSWGWLWNGRIDHQGRLFDPISVRVDTARRAAIRRFRDTSLAAVDTFYTRSCSTRPYDGFELRAKNGAMYMPIPFSAGERSAVGRDGRVWCTDGASFTAMARDLETGDSVAAIAYARTPLSVSPAARDSAIADIRERAQKMGADEPDYSRIPATRPAITQLLIDDQGRVWLRTPALGDTTRYDLFDREGRPLGEVVVPLVIEEWSGIAFRGDTVVAVVLDEDDVPSVVRLHLAPAAP